MENVKFCLVDKGETVKADIQGTGAELAALLASVMIDHPSLKPVVKEALRMAEMDEMQENISELKALLGAIGNMVKD